MGTSQTSSKMPKKMWVIVLRVKKKRWVGKEVLVDEGMHLSSLEEMRAMSTGARELGRWGSVTRYPLPHLLLLQRKTRRRGGLDSPRHLRTYRLHPQK